jgi:hypothetical protein
MNLESYEINEKDSMVFEFVSTSPTKSVKKRVLYQSTDSEDTFNLAFGDVNLETDDFDDKAITNNEDRDKVLATVAKTILIFTEKYPKAYIYAEGSSSARTRLYQMGISKNLSDIQKLFFVYGYLENIGWVKFEKNYNYAAFLIRLKNN